MQLLRLRQTLPLPLRTHGALLTHTHTTPHAQQVLNEVNSEHHMTPAFYTILYDAIVRGIRKWAPRGSANMKFFGLGGAGESYITYFLNRTNHKYPDTPIDFISIHSYASATRDGGVNASAYKNFFSDQRRFVGTIGGVYQQIADSDYPNVMIDCDEVGVILPDDNDGKFNSTVRLRL